MTAPRVRGISPVMDQQPGGIIMWISGSLLTIAIVSVPFIRWMLQQETRQREQEALMEEVDNEIGVM